MESVESEVEGITDFVNSLEATANASFYGSLFSLHFSLSTRRPDERLVERVTFSCCKDQLY